MGLKVVNFLQDIVGGHVRHFLSSSITAPHSSGALCPSSSSSAAISNAIPFPVDPVVNELLEIVIPDCGPSRSQTPAAERCGCRRCPQGKLSIALVTANSASGFAGIETTETS